MDEPSLRLHHLDHHLFLLGGLVRLDGLLRSRGPGTLMDLVLAVIVVELGRAVMTVVIVAVAAACIWYVRRVL